MCDIWVSELFPPYSYVLKCNIHTRRFGDRFGPGLQACFFQSNCHYMMIIGTVITHGCARNEEELHRVKKTNILHTIKRRKEITSSLTSLLTHSKEKRPSWEANRSSTSQEIPRILWNPKVHYRITGAPYREPDRSSPCPTSYFSKIRFNIILQLRQGLPR